MKILIALDLEGVNHVVGEPYMALSKGSEQWRVAIKEAALEINAAADTLFETGAKKVDLWDNHGGGNNIDPADLDPRVGLLSVDPKSPRMYFADGYDKICYFGYHAMEGTLGGVLAHTMSSKSIQYYKLNGKYIGEIDMDAYIAASHGLTSCFYAGGNIACSQAERAVPGIVTVITKKELSRNEAVFRDDDELMTDIKARIAEAVNAPIKSKQLTFPAVVEKSFKRTEDAAKYLNKLLSHNVDAKHPEDDILGKDAHTVVSRIYNIDEFIKCI